MNFIPNNFEDFLQLLNLYVFFKGLDYAVNTIRLLTNKSKYKVK